MTSGVPRLSGDEWQNWANQLLTCHYGPTEYQRVPDNDKGDAGLEGFTFAAGHAYQAYGCEEPLSTQERYKKQRTKMTADLGKFISNQAVLSRIFGQVKITRWVLFVPYYDSKDIVAHASAKTIEVIAAGLPYVAPGFVVKVCQEDEFATARDKVLNATSEGLQIDPGTVTPDKLSKWSAANTPLTDTLDRKIRKLVSLRTEQKRQQFKEKVLTWYLEGQTMLDDLRQYPQMYELVIKAKAHKERFLAAKSLQDSTASDVFRQTVEDLHQTLREEVRGLHKFSAEALAYETVADWLLRCPLDFPDPVES